MCSKILFIGSLESLTFVQQAAIGQGLQLGKMDTFCCKKKERNGKKLN